MAPTDQPQDRRRPRFTPASPAGLGVMLAALAGGLAAAAAILASGREWGPALLMGSLGALLAFGAWLSLGAERRRLDLALERVAEAVASLPMELDRPIAAEPGDPPGCRRLASALDNLREILSLHRSSLGPEAGLSNSSQFEVIDPGRPIALEKSLDDSGPITTLEMVNCLDPTNFHWVDSSPAEQAFLGWSLDQLRRISFLQIIHPEDRPLAWEQLQNAVARGEAMGLVYRVRTARGEGRTVELNVGMRVSSDRTERYLRCHVADVTAKVRADRELRRRTRELTQANQQLRVLVGELKELKDRYRDLYQNTPTMNFSLDPEGIVVECNDTLLATLGRDRSEVVGHPYTNLLAESAREAYSGRFGRYLEQGAIEVESRWVRADGREMDVWIKAVTVVDALGRPIHSRSAAQDITARRALEAELKEKNERLGRANEELSHRNRELDEFTYVVSHDLQEPLRTLIAFSDFLLQDYGDRLDAEGREFVHHLVDASRRLRALITDLLDLSRAGRAAGDFGPVDLDELLRVIRSDLSELIRTRDAELVIAAPLPNLWGDRTRIGQLLANLISNGIKYNRSPKPTVEVGADPGESPSWTTLWVRDNGIGIDPEHHTKIFQIFRRLHSREAFEGTGAGLAIAQKIVQAHGGRIWVESVPGQGSTFFATFPRAADAVARDRAEAIHAS